MKVACLFMVLSVGLLWSDHSMAQCPAGIPSAGNPQCIPPNAWPQNAPASQAARVEPHWELTWGAIAIGLSTGDVGTSVGKSSKRKAEREALDRCAEHGAGDCKKLLFAYENQCAVVAWPEVLGQGANVITQGGPTIEVASELALKSCEGGSGARMGCRIVASP
ncbi:DUF4189 domain-containing protein [Lysobacter sp. CA196]|uniref:DUF4189 domain-containing protein n=1 Tax=Lysobacter sp. CA196 TaxID=3455606 RepID=UPI003F8CFB70